MAKVVPVGGWARDPLLLRAVWRWHFYAGLFVIPFILILSVTGAIYLFKPDLDRWEERATRGLSSVGAVSADAQVAAALAASPAGSRWHHYRIPAAPGDAALIHVGRPNGAMRDVYVAPDGAVLAIVDPEARISAVVARIHGSLLLGQPGRLVVELAASAAILLILTGLWLWWPRGRSGLGGILYPRFRPGSGLGGRRGWRDLHAVTGFWVAGLALTLLVSGLPWTEGWATAFRFVRAELGWVSAAPQDWKGGLPSVQASPYAAHDHGAMARAGGAAARPPPLALARIVAAARREAMPWPAIVRPPGAPARFGPPNGAAWQLTSETQNRPQVRSVWFDPTSGAVVRRSGFADKHPIDRAIGFGIAWHEGQLFGRVNQAVGVLTALALILMAVTGATLWWRRRPARGLGAPAPARRVPPLAWAALILLGLLLPLLGLSLLAIALIEFSRRALRRAPIRWTV